MIEVQGFGQLQFKMKLRPADFIIKKRFRKMKVKGLPCSNECIKLEIGIAVLYNLLSFILSISEDNDGGGMILAF